MMNELIVSIGERAISNFFTPLMLWSIIALLVCCWFGLVKRYHSVLLYGLQVGLLLALPLSILSASLLSVPVANEQITIVYQTMMPNMITITAGSVPVAESQTLNVMPFIAGLLIILSVLTFILFAIRTIWALIILSYWKQNGKPVTQPELRKICDNVISQISVKRKPLILFSDNLSSPATWGFFQPVILIPERLQNPEDFRTALFHECIHVQRSDFIIHVFVSAVRSLFVWHPIVHLLARSVAKNRELSCDSKVLADSSLPAKTYAGLLLNYTVMPKRLSSLSLAMTGSPINLEQRINAMQQHYNKPQQYARAAKTGAFLSTLLIATTFMISACNFGSDGDSVLQQSELDSQPQLIASNNPLFSDQGFSIPPGVDADNVRLEITITQDGKATDPVIVHGVGEHFDSKFTEALQNAEWQPGTIDGSATDSRVTVSFASVQKLLTADNSPSPDSGLMAIYDHLTYPESAREAGAQGTVVVQFVVDKNGQADQFNVIQDIGHGTGEAVIQALKSTTWNPGIHDGAPADVAHQVPVRFQLQ